MPCNKSFNIGRRHIPKEELAANMYSSRKVGSISVLSVLFLNDYVRGNQLRKVVHSQLGEDFLEDVLRLFSMKVK